MDIPFHKSGDYYDLNFEILAGFPAEPPDISIPKRYDPAVHPPRPALDVPTSILSLDGQKISVVGFMIPMVTEDSKVLSFVLAQSRMTCCYGVVPKLNQWIYVRMAEGRPTESMMDVPVTVFGTMTVGTKFDEQNMGWCLYRMVSDRVDLPKKSWF